MSDFENKLLLRNAMNLSREHKRNCKGEKCNISMIELAMLLDRAEIKMTAAQRRVFT